MCLQCRRRGQSNFRGRNDRSLGRTLFMPRKLGQFPCQRLPLYGAPSKDGTFDGNNSQSSAVHYISPAEVYALRSTGGGPGVGLVSTHSLEYDGVDVVICG